MHGAACPQDIKKSNWCTCVHSVVSAVTDSGGLQPTGLLCPWDSPGRNSGAGPLVLLQGIFPTHGSNPIVLCLPALRWTKHKPKKGKQTLALPGSRKDWPSPAPLKLSSCGPACGIHASATGTSGAGPITWSGGDSRWMFGGMCAIPTGASSSKSISCLSSWRKCQNHH